MFDIHSHILPAIDDGPATIEESIRAIMALADEGVTNIVATPHFNDRYPHVPARDIRARAQALQRLARQAGAPVHLWAGHEAALSPTLEADLAAGHIATINDGPYLLLELPTREFPPASDHIIGRLRALGYIPIIAHAERYLPVRRDLRHVQRWTQQGALIQITASSLVGFFGSETRQTAEKLLRHHLVHVIASDAHAIKDRPARFTESIRAAEAIVSRDRVWRMIVETPKAIIHGAPVEVHTTNESSNLGPNADSGRWPFKRP